MSDLPFRLVPAEHVGQNTARSKRTIQGAGDIISTAYVVAVPRNPVVCLCVCAAVGAAALAGLQIARKLEGRVNPQEMNTAVGSIRATTPVPFDLPSLQPARSPNKATRQQNNPLQATNRTRCASKIFKKNARTDERREVVIFPPEHSSR